MFISQAWAQSGVTQGGGIESMLLIVLMFGVLYFMMIRPQMKRAKEHKVMLEALQKGDEVVSGGGILGRITKNQRELYHARSGSGRGDGAATLCHTSRAA